MLELGKIAEVFTGIALRETPDGSARVVRLSDLSDLRAGRVPTLGRGDAPGVARALVIEEGDLLVGSRGSVTDVCIAREPVFGAFVSLDLYLVRPIASLVNPQYLLSFLTLPTTQTQLSGAKQGSRLSRLPKNALENTVVLLPPLQTQRLIAGLALSLQDEDHLLKKLTHLNSILGREAIARAIRAANAQQVHKEHQL
jgi:hypothetical protein